MELVLTLKDVQNSNFLHLTLYTATDKEMDTLWDCYPTGYSNEHWIIGKTYHVDNLNAEWDHESLWKLLPIVTSVSHRKILIEYVYQVDDHSFFHSYTKVGIGPDSIYNFKLPTLVKKEADKKSDK